MWGVHSGVVVSLPPELWPAVATESAPHEIWRTSSIEKSAERGSRTAQDRLVSSDTQLPFARHVMMRARRMAIQSGVHALRQLVEPHILAVESLVHTPEGKASRSLPMQPAASSARLTTAAVVSLAVQHIRSLQSERQQLYDTLMKASNRVATQSQSTFPMPLANEAGAVQPQLGVAPWSETAAGAAGVPSSEAIQQQHALILQRWAEAVHWKPAPPAALPQSLPHAGSKRRRDQELDAASQHDIDAKSNDEMRTAQQMLVLSTNMSPLSSAARRLHSGSELSLSRRLLIVLQQQRVAPMLAALVRADNAHPFRMLSFLSNMHAMMDWRDFAHFIGHQHRQGQKQQTLQAADTGTRTSASVEDSQCLDALWKVFAERDTVVPIKTRVDDSPANYQLQSFAPAERRKVLYFDFSESPLEAEAPASELSVPVARVRFFLAPQGEAAYHALHARWRRAHTSFAAVDDLCCHALAASASSFSTGETSSHADWCPAAGSQSADLRVSPGNAEAVSLCVCSSATSECPWVSAHLLSLSA
jgi:hypothetical protein